MSDEEYLKNIREVADRVTSRQPRITAKELEALVKVMREGGVMDMASGDTRIIMSQNATTLLPGGPLEAMRPVAPASTTPQTTLKDLDDEEELLFASAGGPPK